MKKETIHFTTKITPLENRENLYHLHIKAGAGEIDVVMERSTIRHLLEKIDKGIGTGV